MKYFIFLIPLFLSANQTDLESCYKSGDSECGLLLAQQYKLAKNYEKTAEIYLDISLKTESGSASKELGKIYIYNSGNQTKENCRKGVSYLLNGLSTKNPDIEVFLELSKIFKDGICVPKSEEKAEKYKNAFYKQYQKQKDYLDKTNK